MTIRWLDRAAVHLFPSRCFACGSPLGPVHLLGACGPCWGSLACGASRRCQRCALLLPETAGRDGPARGCCARCVLSPLSFERAAAAVSYGDTARRFLLRAKNGARREIFPLLAAQLAIVASLEGILDDIDGVVPVPSSVLARLRRGFDPAREIARELARITGLRLFDKVLRKRGLAGPGTKSLGARARWSGADHRIAARRTVPGARILLVDDVLTTGATAAACAAALRSAGAVEVRVAVWARTPRPSSELGGSRDSHL